jgi:hypothetical protein
MRDSTLLSLGFGAPLALLAVVLLFWVEANHVAERTSSYLLKVSTLTTTVAVVVLAVSRFVYR